MKLALRSDGVTSVLDVGFREGLALYPLYHEYGFRELVGIEISSERQLVSQINKDQNESFVKLFDVYSKFFRVEPELSGQQVLPQLISEAEYRRIFDFRYSCDASEFVSENSNQYDLVICSNVLHIIPDLDNVKKLVSSLKEYMSENGYIYFRIKERLDGSTIKHFHLFEEIINESFQDPSLKMYNHEVQSSEGRAVTFTNLPE